jgi:hypothetical protein
MHAGQPVGSFPTHEFFHRAAVTVEADRPRRTLSSFRRPTSWMRARHPALGPEIIARELAADAAAGRLGDKAVNAVLAALGLPNRAAPADSHGLSERELEVSRLLARGKSNKEIGARLHISRRTVQVTSGKSSRSSGVRSRAGGVLVRHAREVQIDHRREIDREGDDRHVTAHARNRTSSITPK